MHVLAVLCVCAYVFWGNLFDRGWVGVLWWLVKAGVLCVLLL